MSAYTHPLLSDQDLARLTGYERCAEQKRWLQRHGIKYLERKDGTISTTWGMVEAGMIDNTEALEPNFGALHGKTA